MAHLSHPLDLVAAGVAEGSSAAFSELYEAMADRLFGLAFRLVRDRQEAEDVVQQAFLELVRTDSVPAMGRSLEAWLFASVRFSCQDIFRRRARRPETPSDELPVIGREDRVELGLDPELEQALAELTAEQRAVLHLKHVEELDGSEIAQILGSNRTAVYAMAARAEQRLRKLLRPVESADPPASSSENEHD